MLGTEPCHASLRGAPLALFVLAICAACAQSASGSTFRVVVNLSDQYKSPGLLSEGTPGLFYSTANAVVVFSVAAGGAVTMLATFQAPHTLWSGPQCLPQTVCNTVPLSSLTQGTYSGELRARQ